MTPTVQFTGIPTEDPSRTVTIQLPPSRSNHSWLTRKKIMIIGSLATACILTTAAVSAYYLSNNTDKSSDNLKCFPLYSMAKLLHSPSRSFDNCEGLFEIDSDETKEIYSEEFKNCSKTLCTHVFKVHLENFTSCLYGKTICDCIQIARELFELYCPYAKHIVKTLEECQEHFRIQSKRV